MGQTGRGTEVNGNASTICGRSFFARSARKYLCPRRGGPVHLTPVPPSPRPGTPSSAFDSTPTSPRSAGSPSAKQCARAYRTEPRSREDGRARSREQRRAPRRESMMTMVRGSAWAQERTVPTRQTEARKRRAVSVTRERARAAVTPTGRATGTSGRLHTASGWSGCHGRATDDRSGGADVS